MWFYTGIVPRAVLRKMKRFLFILAVIAVLFATAALLYPKTNGPWTGFVVTSPGHFVADSSHQTLEDCRKYVQNHSGGMCGLDCATDTSCKKSVPVPELISRQ